MVKLHKRKNSIFDILNIIILAVISLTTLYPFVYLLIISISPIEQVIKNGIIIIPEGFTLEYYRYVFGSTGIGSAYAATIFITIVGTLLSLALSSIGAYVLAQKNLPGKNIFTLIIIITMIFNGGMIPSYLVVKGLGLIDSLWSLIIPNAIYAFWLIVMRNFFQSIPASLSESARIDGCSEYRILFAIIIPLSMPILATLALFFGVSQWNQYFNAIIYINSPGKQPLQVLIRRMYQSYMSVSANGDSLPPPVETIRAATIMVATLPILCVYPFLQRYFVQGIMVGAVKG